MLIYKTIKSICLTHIISSCLQCFFFLSQQFTVPSKKKKICFQNVKNPSEIFSTFKILQDPINSHHVVHSFESLSLIDEETEVFNQSEELFSLCYSFTNKILVTTLYGSTKRLIPLDLLFESLVSIRSVKKYF
jgi:hypothetical protein